MKMIRLFSYCLVMVSVLCSGMTAFGAQKATLDQVLSRMDAVGTKLTSMSAVIHQKKWTAILEEFDQGESGHFSFLKTDQGAVLRRDLDEPTDSTLVIKDGEVTFFQPSIKQAQIYKMGSYEDKAEFLLLGFSSADQGLRETYEISLLGQETVEGRETYQLELKPKSEDVAAMFIRIVLWVDDQMWVPIQEQLVEPTDDYLLIRFSNVELDAKLSESDFDVKLPEDVKIIRN